MNWSISRRGQHLQSVVICDLDGDMRDEGWEVPETWLRLLLDAESQDSHHGQAFPKQIILKWGRIWAQQHFSWILFEYQCVQTKNSFTRILKDHACRWSEQNLLLQLRRGELLASWMIGRCSNLAVGYGALSQCARTATRTSETHKIHIGWPFVMRSVWFWSTCRANKHP